jgi:hypothetical protein
MTGRSVELLHFCVFLIGLARNCFGATAQHYGPGRSEKKNSGLPPRSE